MWINRRRVFANDDPDMRPERDAGATVAPEATDLLFEAEDVAELVAEVTGETVEVTADEDQVVFSVGDAEYTVEAEGDEEVLETSRRALRGKRPVRASQYSYGRRTPARRDAAPRGNTVRKLPKTR